MARHNPYASIPTYGDLVNDLRWYDEETEARNDLFGRGQNNRGCAPAPVYNNINSATGVINPMTGAAVRTAGSFGELIGK